MKNLSSTLIACLLLTFVGCKKDSAQPKDQLPQKVTYEVTGTNILVSIRDKDWQGVQLQQNVVSGSWRHECMFRQSWSVNVQLNCTIQYASKCTLNTLKLVTRLIFSAFKCKKILNRDRIKTGNERCLWWFILAYTKEYLSIEGTAFSNL